MSPEQPASTRGPLEDRLWNAFDPMSLRFAGVAAPHESDPQAVVSANVSTRRRRFPTEFALPFAGIGLGIAGTLGNGGDAVGLLWSLGGALVVLGIYFGILAAFVGVLERRARAAELADPASVQLLGFLTKSGRVAFGLPPSNLVRNIVLIGLTGDSVRVQTRTRSIDVTTPCSSARAIDFDVNEGVIAAGLRFKGGIEIDCGIGTVRIAIMPRGRGGTGFMNRAEVDQILSKLEVNTGS